MTVGCPSVVIVLLLLLTKHQPVPTHQKMTSPGCFPTLDKAQKELGEPKEGGKKNEYYQTREGDTLPLQRTQNSAYRSLHMYLLVQRLLMPAAAKCQPVIIIAIIIAIIAEAALVHSGSSSKTRTRDCTPIERAAAVAESFEMP
uniref:Uncharacterized protein n=1 Tax=Anopheles coluzzii TaxID=1518534 RepID=A0A8W7P2P4_ANOCL